LEAGLLSNFGGVEMQFWGYMAQSDGEPDLWDEFENRVCRIRRYFVEEAGGMNALADLLITEGCERVVIRKPEALSPNGLTRQVILNEFRKRRIGVWSLDHWQRHTKESLWEQIDQLKQADPAAWAKAIWWWHSTFDVAQEAEAPSFATVSEVIKASDQFRVCLQAATQRQRGKRPGRSTFGQRAEEKLVVQRLLTMRQAHMSYTAIANTLNEEGHRTLTGKPFHPQTVKNYVLRWGNGNGKTE
jgi:hypothetical protein